MCGRCCAGPARVRGQRSGVQGKLWWRGNTYATDHAHMALAVRELLEDRATVKRARELGLRVPPLAKKCRSARGWAFRHAGAGNGHAVTCWRMEKLGDRRQREVAQWWCGRRAAPNCHNGLRRLA